MSAAFSNGGSFVTTDEPEVVPARQTMSGPCCICGATNYALSCGGPTICPKCDCGQLDAATVEQQAKIIKGLREEVDGALASSGNWKRQFFDMVRQRNEAQGKHPKSIPPPKAPPWGKTELIELISSHPTRDGSEVSSWLGEFVVEHLAQRIFELGIPAAKTQSDAESEAEHLASYLRAWNEALEMVAGILDDEGSGTPAEKIRKLLDLTRAPSSAAGMPHRAIEIVRLIEALRADEGDSVTILCDNPDFNGQPNCAVECCGDWTGWLRKRFSADTVLDALSMAMTERNLPSSRKVIAKSNGHHWVQRFNLVCCRDCGFVRRADDQNSPCKGPVGVGIRRDLLPEPPSPAASEQLAQLQYEAGMYQSLYEVAQAKVEQLREALKMARARVEYLGAVCTDPRHFANNQEVVLPKIDAALSALSSEDNT